MKGIYDRLDHQIATPDADLELFKDELANIWFTKIVEVKKTIGFGHIFCGKPNNKLGDMHFIGRYINLKKINGQVQF